MCNYNKYALQGHVIQGTVPKKMKVCVCLLGKTCEKLAESEGSVES